MLKSEAARIVGGLSRTSKLPGPSFGLSAYDCKTGGKLARVPGSVCSSCYARKGQYSFRNVREAHARRLALLATALADDAARVRWIDAMATLLNGVTHFRWHDSGDLQSAAHFCLIADVCRATPNTRHWLPTKEPRFVDLEAIPENLVVRVSAPMVDSDGPTGYPHVSAVHTSFAVPGAFTCRAPSHGGECRDCRACWDPRVRCVSYAKH